MLKALGIVDNATIVINTDTKQAERNNGRIAVSNNLCRINNGTILGKNYINLGGGSYATVVIRNGTPQILTGISKKSLVDTNIATRGFIVVDESNSSITDNELEWVFYTGGILKGVMGGNVGDMREYYSMFMCSDRVEKGLDYATIRTPRQSIYLAYRYISKWYNNKMGIISTADSIGNDTKIGTGVHTYNYSNGDIIECKSMYNGKGTIGSINKSVYSSIIPSNEQSTSRGVKDVKSVSDIQFIIPGVYSDEASNDGFFDLDDDVMDKRYESISMTR